MITALRVALLSGLAAVVIGNAVPASAQTAPAAPPAGRAQRVDMMTLKRPIEMRDTVWIEEMTLPEVRDKLAAGQTTAMIFAGGMEDNGPYVVVNQHGATVRGMCDLIARKLGNAMCAPVAALAPANLEKMKSPGSVSISAETFKALLTDEATSLKAQGFKNILFLCDHGSDEKPMKEAVAALAEKWAGSGANAHYIAEYYDDDALIKFEQNELGVHEDTSGPRYHDDYPYDAVSLVFNAEDLRMSERAKVKQTTVNGIDLAVPKALADGKKIVAFHVDRTVDAIKKLAP